MTTFSQLTGTKRTYQCTKTFSTVRLILTTGILTCVRETKMLQYNSGGGGATKTAFDWQGGGKAPAIGAVARALDALHTVPWSWCVTCVICLILSNG